MPRRLADLAAGMACSSRHTPSRSLRIRSAVHGGGSESELGIRPSPTSADESACAAADEITATVWPASCRSASAVASAESMEARCRGRRSSNAGCSSPRSSISTEISSRPARRASASTAEASGSCVGPISASIFGVDRMPANGEALLLQQQLGAIPRRRQLVLVGAADPHHAQGVRCITRGGRPAARRRGPANGVSPDATAARRVARPNPVPGLRRTTRGWCGWLSAW